ncbi:hypothetical protein JW979_07475 [bacterium]|nr:hypothetical protein [candidate division CSSED10-310 bacterium]
MAKNLSDDQKSFYENVYKVSKQEIEAISAQIERELAEVKERITKLNQEKQAVRQMYDGACARLGIESEFDKAEDSEVIEEEEE